MQNRPVNLFSDLLVRHMGDLPIISFQNGTGPDEFRATPPRGAGQRLFFLHDGRTSDLLAAIEDHRSPQQRAIRRPRRMRRSIRLARADKQATLDFLRSL
jgi:CxxC motif-containing protein (DUF1111 family)